MFAKNHSYGKSIHYMNHHMNCKFLGFEKRLLKPKKHIYKF